MDSRFKLLFFLSLLFVAFSAGPLYAQSGASTITGEFFNAFTSSWHLKTAPQCL